MNGFEVARRLLERAVAHKEASSGRDSATLIPTLTTLGVVMISLLDLASEAEGHAQIEHDLQARRGRAERRIKNVRADHE